jgi:hypothetical protein
MKPKKLIDDIIRDKANLPLAVPDAEGLWKDMLSKLENEPPGPGGPVVIRKIWSSRIFRIWCLVLLGIVVTSALYLTVSQKNAGNSNTTSTDNSSRQPADNPAITGALVSSGPEPETTANKIPVQPDALTSADASGRSYNQTNAAPGDVRNSVSSDPSRIGYKGISQEKITPSGLPPVLRPDQSKVASGSDPVGVLAGATSGFKTETSTTSNTEPAFAPEAESGPKKFDLLQPIEVINPDQVHFSRAETPVKKVTCPVFRPKNGWSVLFYIGSDPHKAMVDGEPPTYLLNLGIGVRKAFRDNWYGQLDVSLNKFRTPNLSYTTVKHAVKNAHDVLIDSFRPIYVTGISLNLTAGKEFRYGTSIFGGIEAGYLFKANLILHEAYNDVPIKYGYYSYAYGFTDESLGNVKTPAWIRPLDLGLRIGVEQKLIFGSYIGIFLRQGLIDMTRPSGAYTTYTNLMVYGGFRF